jgi:hypothetical protein
MTARKSQDVIKVTISETNPQEVLIAGYLRDSGKIKAQCMEAIEGYWYSYALSKQPGSSDAEVELAVAESVMMLSTQINRILNFHRIDRQIVLPHEFLTRCGLLATFQPVTATTSDRELSVPELEVAIQQVSAVEASSSHREDKDLVIPIAGAEHSERPGLAQGAAVVNHGGLKFTPDLWQKLTKTGGV